jgi:hypothetical protein
MEQGFSDACVALCMEERAVPRVAQTCRSAAIEMPRPTVRRWCEHGYNTAFQKTMRDLSTHFKTESAPTEPEPEEEYRETARDVMEEQSQTEESAEPQIEKVNEEHNTAPQHHEASGLRGSASRTVVSTIPITIGEETKNLLVHEGESAEEAVVAFCRENVPDDVSTCIRQLIGTVVEKLENGV